jgi:hypothetical protein|tara:strand:- start:566 stop:1060 length:495 start_codon:yes stop_codon:yes gene_type:complete
MAWQTEMTTLLRYVINDTDATSYEFTDSRLQTLIVSSAQMTLGVVDFPRDYNIDIPSTGIAPDPTSTQDNGFINLVVLKAACMLADGEYRTASNKGIVIKDGPSAVDARALIASKQQIAKDACAKYEKAELEFRLGNSKAGEAIIGPHRNAVYGGSTPIDKFTR